MFHTYETYDVGSWWLHLVRSVSLKNAGPTHHDTPIVSHELLGERELPVPTGLMPPGSKLCCGSLSEIDSYLEVVIHGQDLLAIIPDQPISAFLCQDLFVDQHTCHVVQELPTLEEWA